MKKLNKNIIDALYYLEQNPTESYTSVAKKFNIGRKSLSKWEKLNYKDYTIESKLKQHENELIYFTPEELDMLYEYKNNLDLTYSDFKKKFPCAPSKKETLYVWLEILGLETFKKKQNSYKFDRNKFFKIENEEDAYWLGFITADGCIVNDERLSINLAEKDRKHLEKFCKYVGLSEDSTKQIIKNGFGGAYTKDNPIVSLNICSRQIVNNLKEKGITARKSGKEIPYICSTKELERAYIRGLIDGDGYVRETQYGFGLVGSKQICEYVQNYISENIKNISTNHIREHGTIFKLEVTGKTQTSYILEKLYENATIYLDRKIDLIRRNYNCRV